MLRKALGKGAMPTLAVGMSQFSRVSNMPTASVGMAPDLPQRKLTWRGAAATKKPGYFFRCR